MAEKNAEKSDVKVIAEAIGEAIRANRPQGPLEQAGFSEARIAELTEPPKPKKWREVKCRSEDTGATFTACVVESRAMVAGRIIQLKDYRHPVASATFQKDGGLVPDGMQILRAGMASPNVDPNTIPKQDFTPHYLAWRWQEFWKQDLKRHIGKELKAHMCASPQDLSTAWQEGRVRAEDAA